MNAPQTKSLPQFFRSTSQLNGDASYEEFLDREFPKAASEFPEGISRRRWMQLMGASAALATAAGCRYQRQEFAAFVVPPEGRVPGLPQQFATNYEWAGRIIHALVQSTDGRPVKIDGNAMHPMYASTAGSTFGDGRDAAFAHAGTDVFTQGSLLSLYDPDRIGAVVLRGQRDKEPTGFRSVAATRTPIDWTEFDREIVRSADRFTGGDGTGLAIIYEPCRSPSINRLLAAVKEKLPAATLVRYESVYKSNIAKGVDAAGGGRNIMSYRLDRADVIAAIDADLFGLEDNATFYMRQFSKNRLAADGRNNRLYSIEGQYSVTGTTADFRLPLRSSQMTAFLRELERRIDESGSGADAGQEGAAAEPEAIEPGSYTKLSPAARLERVLDTLAADLLATKGRSLVAVGFHQEPEAHRIALRINAKLENIGKTVVFTEPNDPLADVETIGLDEFVLAHRQTPFTAAWIFAHNPVFTAPGDIDLPNTLLNIPTVVYATEYDDETAVLSTWSLPTTHPLESWGDVRSVDGTYSITQPLIAPVTGARSHLELLAILAGLEVKDSLAIVQETCRGIAGGAYNDLLWQQILHDGFLTGSESPAVNVQISTAAPERPVPGIEDDRHVEILASDPDNVDLSQLEVLVLPSETIYDGRLANNGWMQECPYPVTKLTWDNAALMSIDTARALGLSQNVDRDARMTDIIVIRQGDAYCKVPLFVVPGMAEGQIVVQMGYGRQRSGTVGGLIGEFQVGHNVQGLRRWEQAFLQPDITVVSTRTNYKIATTQDHFAISDNLGMSEIPKRASTIIREGTLEEYEEHPSFAKVHQHHEIDSLWEEPDVSQGHAWGMAIDLNKCTGCNACVIACQAENNVPIVGKEQVSRGREMHWLRIDRYFTSDMEATKASGDYTNPRDPRIVTQPMACQHCETAPCEQVCPVAATVHTPEGINAMAYNRCVGTRYCANNCPYKVRRFNYFNYNQKYGYYYGWQDKREEVSTKLQSLVLNPEVTVRGRGVMEKCTYCIQRIQNGKIMARNEDGIGIIEDGEIRTACQEACPTQAIIFGDLLDETARVRKLHEDPRAYAVLEELNVKPRTLYLARVRNVPPALMTYDQAHPQRSLHEEHAHGAHDGDTHHGPELEKGNDGRHPPGDHEQNRLHDGAEGDHTSWGPAVYQIGSLIG